MVTSAGFFLQKLMLDEKKCYFFGRNKHLCDFCIDHQSCSRVHAALVWHKHLNRPFIIDLGSSKYLGQVAKRLKYNDRGKNFLKCSLVLRTSTPKFLLVLLPNNAGHSRKYNVILHFFYLSVGHWMKIYACPDWYFTCPRLQDKWFFYPWMIKPSSL